MEYPPGDLGWFAENLAETVQEIVDAWADSGASADYSQASPEIIQEALEQLIEVLRASDWDKGSEQLATAESPPAGVGVSELGDYGLSMLTDLSHLAVDLRLTGIPERLEQLAVSLALWVIGRDGELNTIELVVNGLARLANNTLDEAELERLFVVMGEVQEAISPRLMQRQISHPTQQPWQLLLLNRAIVATRSLIPQLMEQAFAEIAEQMPERAPGFFREGMEQIKLRGYPKPVSEIIERYYREWPAEKILH